MLMTNKLLIKYLEKLKLFHKLYKKIEDSNIIADYVIEDDLDIDEVSYEQFKSIEDVQNICKWKIKWNFGDLVSFSSYRDTWTYIIGKEGKLIGNPNYDGGAGYLAIPYEITKYLKNVKKKYKNLEHIMYFDLRFDDIFIKNYIGILDSNWNLTYTFCEIESCLIINFNKNNSKEFDINLKNQQKWIEFKRCKNNLLDELYVNVKEYLGVIDYDDIMNYYFKIDNQIE